VLNSDFSVSPTIIHCYKYIYDVKCVLFEFLVREIEHESTELDWQSFNFYFAIFLHINIVALFSFCIYYFKFVPFFLLNSERWLSFLVSLFYFFFYHSSFLDYLVLVLVLFLNVCEELVPELFIALLECQCLLPRANYLA